MVPLTGLFYKTLEFIKDALRWYSLTNYECVTTNLKIKLFNYKTEIEG